MAKIITDITQVPSPGSHRVKYAGSVLFVSLEISTKCEGTAFLRTNLGQVKSRWQEILAFHETGRNPMGRDWSDIPMRQVSPKRFEIRLPLYEVGRFEFKAYFQMDDEEQTTIWPDGENAVVKVEPAATYAGNSIYNAFVRQFGPNLSKRGCRPDLDQAEQLLNYENYTVIPPSGTFRDLKEHLDFIIDRMGFNIIQLLPVHPIPSVYARMGRFGSPFAALDFFSVESSLAQFDRSHTPMDQFVELVDEIHARNAMIFLDLPADHTGWASVMQTEHPDWFRHNHDGSFESPGAWGTIWADLVKLDFKKQDLWNYLAEVFLHWCRMGVDGFRCDAGYMIPPEAWTYIITKVRAQFQDTIFFLEGLGGGIDATDRLLTAAGMNWAYSELFQNYSSDQISGYLDHATKFSQKCGTLVHFAETHDNDRLAKVSKQWAKMRTVMAALFAPAGCYGIANGVEWFATEKIDVHNDSSLNWGADENMVQRLTFLNQLLTNHPAFSGEAALTIPVGASGSAVGLLRKPINHEYDVLAIVNPDEHHGATYKWNVQEFDPGDHGALDLLTGQIIPCRRSQCSLSIHLEPTQAVCLALKAPALPAANAPTPTQHQLLRNTVMRFIVAVRGFGDLGDIKIQKLAEDLYNNPVAFIRGITGQQAYVPIVEWLPQRDEYKTTPVPCGHMLLVYSEKPFRASLFIDGVCHQRLLSCPRSDGRWFTIFSPTHPRDKDTAAELRLNVYDGGQAKRTVAKLLLIASNSKAKRSINYRLDGHLLSGHSCAISTTIHGGYSLARAKWGTLHSAYDALLAANLDTNRPTDRRVILTMCNVGVRHHGFIQKVSIDCQTDFSVLPNGAMRWCFVVPTGMGRNVYLAIISHLDKESGVLTLAVSRRKQPEEDTGALEADYAVEVAVRPYLENRSNHCVTKASQGPEFTFPSAIVAGKNDFTFNLGDGAALQMSSAVGEFFFKPKWEYSNYYPLEANRGLESTGDLFTPGYFHAFLKSGEICTVTAQVKLPKGKALKRQPGITADDIEMPNLVLPMGDALKRAINDFVADRDGLKTVIAGYPWFLDWGRDTLICLRGMLAAGFEKECANIIKLFASYEENGTIPNMICGHDISNRDTSDAPLWLILATKAYLEKTGKTDFLKQDCNGRTLQDVMMSIVNNYSKGTPNGIRMDEESGLIYSPAHFTWMDTNYPACTPREGYPVEIQAMWIASLNFLNGVTGNKNLAKLAKQATDSLTSMYMGTKFIGLSDCLHCHGFQPAKNAVADDHCRPNQLFAITLGAITDHQLCSWIIRACQGLIVPGGLRTLADMPVQYALPLDKNGHLLNDPLHPYWGHYEGDEDTKRKPAYHNGTAWPWLLPSYCEALYMTYGDSAKDAALAWLSTVEHAFQFGCIGHIPEVLDGNTPHRHGGCTAQAWSATETYRVLAILCAK